jgi:hypothetical protein
MYNTICGFLLLSFYCMLLEHVLEASNLWELILGDVSTLR